MLSSLKNLLYLLSESDKKDALKLLILLAFMGLVEMLGIASILPFLAVVGNPEMITENQSLNSVYLWAQLFFYKMSEDLFVT